MASFAHHRENETLDRLYEFSCLAISLAGLAVRILTVGFVMRGSSGRNTKAMRAEQLNQSGLYSVVRHPLYLGNYLVFLGMLALIGTWWLPVIGSLIYCIYYERIIIAEESVLYARFGKDFTDWASHTPAFIPNWTKWRRPINPFSIRSVIRREYTTFFMIIAVFSLIDVAGNFIAHRTFGMDIWWAYVFATSVAIYISIRFIKKCTNLLKVHGR